MKYNPFRPNSIVTPGMFQGRDEEIEVIHRCLNQAMHGNPQHFIVEGERGVGKQALATGKIPIHDDVSLSFLVSLMAVLIL